MLVLQIGFEEDGIVILKKDFQYKISMSELIAIFDDGVSFRMIFYYQDKPFAFEVIKKSFSLSLVETMNTTLSPLSCFTKSRSAFMDVWKKHEAKNQCKIRCFEFQLGKLSE